MDVTSASTLALAASFYTCGGDSFSETSWTNLCLPLSASPFLSAAALSLKAFAEQNSTDPCSRLVYGLRNLVAGLVFRVEHSNILYSHSKTVLPQSHWSSTLNIFQDLSCVFTTWLNARHRRHFYF